MRAVGSEVGYVEKAARELRRLGDLDRPRNSHHRKRREPKKWEETQRKEGKKERARKEERGYKEQVRGGSRENDEEEEKRRVETGGVGVSRLRRRRRRRRGKKKSRERWCRRVGAEKSLWRGIFIWHKGESSPSRHSSFPFFGSGVGIVSSSSSSSFLRFVV